MTHRGRLSHTVLHLGNPGLGLLPKHVDHQWLCLMGQGSQQNVARDKVFFTPTMPPATSSCASARAQRPQHPPQQHQLHHHLQEPTQQTSKDNSQPHVPPQILVICFFVPDSDMWRGHGDPPRPVPIFHGALFCVFFCVLLLCCVCCVVRCVLCVVWFVLCVELCVRVLCIVVWLCAVCCVLCCVLRCVLCVVWFVFRVVWCGVVVVWCGGVRGVWRAWCVLRVLCCVSRVPKLPPVLLLSVHSVGIESSSTVCSFPADYPKPNPLIVVWPDRRQRQLIN